MFSTVFLLPSWLLNFLTKPLRTIHRALFCKTKPVEWLKCSCKLLPVTIHLSMGGNALYVLYLKIRLLDRSFSQDILVIFQEAGGSCIIMVSFYAQSKNIRGWSVWKQFLNMSCLHFLYVSAAQRLWLMVALMWLHTSTINNSYTVSSAQMNTHGRRIDPNCWKKISLSTQVFKVREETNTNEVSEI